MVADSGSSSREALRFSLLDWDRGLVKKDFDHEVNGLAFLGLAFKGEGFVGGGSKKGRAVGAGEVGRNDGDEERERWRWRRRTRVVERRVSRR